MLTVADMFQRSWGRYTSGRIVTAKLTSPLLSVPRTSMLSTTPVAVPRAVP